MNRKQRRRARQRAKRSAANNASRRTPPGQQPSRAPLADNREAIAAVESFDNFAKLRNALRAIGQQRGDWAGIPMPLEGHRIVIEPRYPMAKELALIGNPDPEPDTSGARIVNQFYSHARRSDILIWRERDGRVQWGQIGAFHSIGHAISTIGASVVWGIEQEANAVQLLATMLRHHQMKQYLLTGMFLESSERSGLTYIFRKLRPTVVIDAREGDRMIYDVGETALRKFHGGCRILCALCMHPIAYYEGSWAGAMCPTDDVIAHLALMRGDEAMLWRRSNQHAPHRPEAGL